MHETRVEIGRRLAQEYPADGDLVIPVPDSGTPAAVGYAQGSGIPFGLGLVKTPMWGGRLFNPRRPSGSWAFA